MRRPSLGKHNCFWSMLGLLATLCVYNMALTGCQKASATSKSASQESNDDQQADGRSTGSNARESGTANAGAATTGDSADGDYSGALLSFESPVSEPGRGFPVQPKLNGIEPGSEPVLSQPMAMGVAVIDLNRVAIGLDRLKTFEDQLQTRRQELEEKVQLLDDAYQAEIDELVGPEGRTDEAMARESVIEKENERQISLATANRQAIQEIALLEESIKREFMDEVRPIAFMVASDRGFGVVLTVPQVYAFAVDSNYDITNDVIDRMSVQSPSSPQSDLPNLSRPSHSSSDQSDEP